jgi:putative transposase
LRVCRHTPHVLNPQPDPGLRTHATPPGQARTPSTLVTNALSMAIHNRRAQESGLCPSMGSIGDCFDNAVIESFWGRMQTELLNRKRWKTRIELANAIFDYLEIFHNRQRRHSSIGMLTPIEYEILHQQQPVA